jgi:hypothetical protein
MLRVAVLIDLLWRLERSAFGGRQDAVRQLRRVRAVSPTRGAAKGKTTLTLPPNRPYLPNMQSMAILPDIGPCGCCLSVVDLAFRSLALVPSFLQI